MNEIRIKFGALLKAERENKGIKLENLAEQLKISKDNLEAIEKGDAEALPSDLYTNLFTKSYSEALGIDYTRTMEAIEEDLGDAPSENKNGKPDKNSEIENEDEESEATPVNDNILYKKLAYIFGGIVIIFIVFIAVNKFFLSGSEDPSGSDMSENSEEATTTQSAVSDEELAGFNWEETDYTSSEKIKIRFLPKDQSWATVLADGDTAIYRTLNAGRIYDVEADYRLLVSVGIPSVVDIELNGQKVNLVNPESRRISRVDINQMNLDNFINPTLVENNAKNTAETDNSGEDNES